MDTEIGDFQRPCDFWRNVESWQGVTQSEFLEHNWQERNSITSVTGLASVLGPRVSQAFLQDAHRGLALAPMVLRMSPYLVALVDWENAANDPIRRQFLPLASEFEADHPMLTLDSLKERDDSPVAGVTHRYPDRVLLIALDTCPVYCRFCTRSYAVGLDTETTKKVHLPANTERWKGALEYISGNPSIEDVVVSGGDAYRLKAAQLEFIGTELLKLPNILRIRIATKGLAVQPMKILTDIAWTDALMRVADFGHRHFKEVSVHTHFNHPREVTSITEGAMRTLHRAGITVRNQCVLQRRVNDNPTTMLALCRALSRIQVHPYYTYLCDLVKGVETLRTSLEDAIQIEKQIRGSIAGYNTPLTVVDVAGGGGKRDVHSYESYSRETGISVYQAPAVKAGQFFFYYDPLHSLDGKVQEAWCDPKRRHEMIRDALPTH